MSARARGHPRVLIIRANGRVKRYMQPLSGASQYFFAFSARSNNMKLVGAWGWKSERDK